MTVNSIAFIPDGNRRYAEKMSIPYPKAYAKGFDKAEQVFDWCMEKKIKASTVYSLSSENLSRTSGQLRLLFSLYKYYLGELVHGEKIHANEVRVKVIGKFTKVPGLQSIIKKLHDSTKNYDNHHLNIALGYGGREELVDAAKKIAASGEEITEENFSKYLYTEDEPELLIRTSGMQRLSNFLPWQTAYTELYFSPVLWPEFSRQNFDEALEWHSQTKRNFGK